MTTEPRPTASTLLGLDRRDARFGTAFALYAQFARSTGGRLLYRGTWIGLGALSVAVIAAALMN